MRWLTYREMGANPMYLHAIKGVGMTQVGAVAKNNIEVSISIQVPGPGCRGKVAALIGLPNLLDLI